VSDDGVRELIEKCPDITDLYVCNCDEATSGGFSRLAADYSHINIEK
jgi:hypothetical protein